MAVDQQQVITFLSEGASYGAPGAPVDKIETHISIVFLVGGFAYKLKRAVRLSYVDYTQPGMRETYCRAELVLNQRTAPELYLRVRAVTRDAAGRLGFDGPEPAIDWVVQMKRFDQNDLLDRRAAAGTLTPAMMRDLADRVASFHATAEVDRAHGGHAGMREAIAGNIANLSASCPPLDRTLVEQLEKISISQCATLGGRLDARRAEGKIRLCHGDLHLRNICLLDGRPTIFDGIEFNEAFSRIDVLYDLAFLLMDLLHRDFPGLATLVANRYLDRTGDAGGLFALPLFISVRAAIRAHVLVAQYRTSGRAEDAAAAQSYLRCAVECLRPQRPCLIAIGGLSGTGKSTLAAALAPGFLPAPGARVIRSDVIRKTLFHAAPETRLPAAAYGADVTRQVYQNLRDEAAQALACGYTAIADATFLAAGERRAIAAVAAHAGVPFFGFWLAADRQVLLQRLASRRNDASDADAAILLQQEDAGPGEIEWPRIGAGATIEQQAAIIREHLPARDVPPG